jgi:predicted AlkP superfamily phosphohydrolase/phosphomutase
MRVLILGIDSFDPIVFERLASEGKMPHLAKYLDSGKYDRFIVSDPPQTEVSWTSIATGLDPGGHGIFDFVHRDPGSYSPFVSLLPTERKAFGLQFKPPYRARTIFEEATRMGYPAASLWWPATFPARPELPVNTIPGLGTPDILGKLGVGTFFTSDTDRRFSNGKTPLKIFDIEGSKYASQIEGPLRKKGDHSNAALVNLKLEVIDEQNARMLVGGQPIDLRVGYWSPILEIPFKMGFLMTVRTLTRAVVTQIHPCIQLYMLPLQVHPLASPWRYATPPAFIKDIWKSCGPYLTLGWPQDTTGLEEGFISDTQFISLCESIHAHRERVLFRMLEDYTEGLIGIVFDSLDRIQHMFRRDRPDIIESWYQKMDALVGRVEKRLQKIGGPATKLLVLSDHGFADFDSKVHLNRWLVEKGYLSLKGPDLEGNLGNVNWQDSQAYAVGLNSLYLNLQGREAEGSVSEDNSKPLLTELRDQLTSWRAPADQPVVQRALLREKIYSGPYSDLGPDILIGYSPGYRASQDTGLGKWGNTSLEANPDHWSGDHCIDSTSVPGVIFCSQGFEGLSDLSFRDIPRLTLGKELDGSNGKPPQKPASLDESEKEAIEERLKSLGYL